MTLLTPLPIGELIVATTTAFTAQCIEVPRPDRVSALPDPPPFGAFVRIGDVMPTEALPEDFDPFVTGPAPPSSEDGPRTLYAVVYLAETGPLEAGRPLTAFGLDEEELRREQPQIYELLATRFSACLVAHRGSDGVMRPSLPPRPPRPHARVYVCGDSEVRELTERLDYLRGLLTGSLPVPPDELVAALLRSAWRAHGGDESFLLRAGRELAALLPRDYDRLRALIGRITS